MSPTHTARLRRTLPVLSLALIFYGCSDAAEPLAPRIPTTPNPLVGPVITVINTDDAGAGSLRQAILDATDGTTIQFDAAIAGQTIVLSTGHITVNKPLTIEGPLAAGMTISGGLASRVFLVGEDGNVVFRNLSIVDGREKFAGGLEVAGIATLDHSLVANNETDEADGGGIFVRPLAELTLVNSTVSGNVSARNGGGIAAGAARLSIRSSTVAYNFAGGGGGIAISNATLTLRNSIIANNVDNDGAAIEPNCEFDGVNTTSFAGRNISNDESCGSGLGIIVANPNLLPLTTNGGPTKTNAISFGPAIDGGSECSESTDQRYVARNQGLTCDVGAFEFNTFGTLTLTLSPNMAVNAKTGVATMSGTITCSAAAAVTVGVQLSQTQKTTGKFATIIQGQANANVATCGPAPSSWSTAVTPASGKFEPGAANGTASTPTVTGGFLPASVTEPVKLFQVK